MFVNSDFSDLLRIFNANHVRYLVIGGYAVVQYTEPRFTKDLDIWISTDSANAKAVYNALKEFGAPLTDLSAKDFSEEGYFFQMGVPGTEFEGCWDRRVEVDFDDLKVNFISKQDLIVSKRASGRPQDLLDADSLEQT